MRILLLGAACVLAGSPAGAATTVLWEYTDGDVTAGKTEESVAYDVAVDGNGEVYVAGWRVSSSADGRHEAVLRKLSSYGGVVWTVSSAGAGSTSFESSARAVALYPTGTGSNDVIVGGRLWNGATTGTDFWLARYLPSGTAAVWSLTESESALSTDSIEDIAVVGGTIFVAGHAGSPSGDTDLWVAKYDGAGSRLSFYKPVDFVGVDEAVLAVAASESTSALYVAGYVDKAGTGKDIWVASLTKDLSDPAIGLAGTWMMTINGSMGTTDYASDVSIDSAGNVLVAGTVTTTRYRDAWVAGISPDGVLAWTRTLDGGEGDHDGATGCLAAGPAGEFLVAGYVDRPPAVTNSFTDVWLAGMSSAGAVLWEIDRDGAGHYNDGAEAVTSDASGYAYVAGYAAGGTGIRAMYVGKFGEAAVAVTAPAAVDPFPHAFPNPFRPGSGGAHDAAGITFRSLPPGATVRIYSLGGTGMNELVDLDGDGIIVWDAKNRGGRALASGVYFYVVDTPLGRSARGKVVIIR